MISSTSIFAIDFSMNLTLLSENNFKLRLVYEQFFHF